MASAALHEIVHSFRLQAGWCDRLGSPFTARLLECAVNDLESGGPLSDVICAWPGDPIADALPLRVAGALHALVLSGEAPDLAAIYPPQRAGLPDPGALWPVVLAALAAHRPHVQTYLASPPQTNEVSRSAVLLGGFLEIARLTAGRLPLRLLEIGASAGLNQLWDRYRYRLGEEGNWGDPASPVRISTRWTGPLPRSLDIVVRVAERAACDLSPIDLDDDAQCLRLRSYVWADQRERLARLDAAIDLARRAGIEVEQADAAVWVERQLSKPADGRATVLYHSIMWQYMPQETRERIADAVAAAARRARADAPLAWLRYEPPAPEARQELRLMLWPGGEERLLARAHPHGTSVHWLAPDDGSAGDEPR
jgi:hypothetical protein